MLTDCKNKRDRDHNICTHLIEDISWTEIHPGRRFSNKHMNGICLLVLLFEIFMVIILDGNLDGDIVYLFCLRNYFFSSSKKTYFLSPLRNLFRISILYKYHEMNTNSQENCNFYRWPELGEERNWDSV